MRRSALFALALCLAFAANCAYYNIFWTAQSDYKQAVEAGGYDFWDPYEQPPVKGDSDRLIDSCIERCGKLLLLHPNSGWVDDALYLMGNCFVIRGEHQNALRKYDEILQLYASSDFAPMARYMKAYTLIRDGSTQQGTALLTRLAEESKSDEVRQRSIYLLGRSALERDDCDRAVPLFETYLAEFSGKARADRVRLHLAACLLETGRADRVVGALEPLAGKKGGVGFEATLMMGEAYRLMGQNDRAIAIFTELTEKSAVDSIRARSMMETARAMAARQEAKEAVTVLDEAAEIATAKTKGLHDEIIFTKGLIHEKDLDDFETAIAAYDKIATSPSSYGKMANKRSAALKDVLKFTRALSDTMPDTPEEEAQNRFRLGETYVDDLALRDEGLAEFRTVADSLPDTKFGPRAMLRAASMLEAADDSLARAYYSKVIETRPGSPHANFARSQLGLSLVDVVFEKPDSLVWDEGQVLGPSLPPTPADSLSLVGPPVPPDMEPAEVERAAPDTSRHGSTFRPDSLRARSRPPEPTGLRFPQSLPAGRDSADTTGLPAGSDTSGTQSPGDSTGAAGRDRP